MVKKKYTNTSSVILHTGGFLASIIVKGINISENINKIERNLIKVKLNF